MSRFWHWLRGRHDWAYADYCVTNDHLDWFEGRCDCGHVVKWESTRHLLKAVLS